MQERTLSAVLRTRLAVCLAVLILCLAASAATAQDSKPPKVLVTLDGERIELRGEFEERGKRVVFKDKQGRLRSLPKSAVDFEATRAAGETPDTSSPKPVNTAPPPLPVLVLDQTNTRSFERPAAVVAPTSTPVRKTTSSKPGSDDSETQGKSAGDPEKPEDVEAPASEGSSLEVQTWDDQGSEEEGESGTDIWGSVKNTGGIAATEIKVEVRLLSGDGTLLANDTVAAFEATLRPGEATNFNASWDERVFYDEVEFQVSYLEVGR